MTNVKSVTGTVRFGKSFLAPSSQQTVRVILTDIHEKTVWVREFTAADVAKEPKAFSSPPLRTGEGYRIYVETGPFRDLPQSFSLSDDHDLAPIEFVIGSDN
jgi:hypothetical protein